MKLTLVRNATLLLETSEGLVLVTESSHRVLTTPQESLLRIRA